MQKLKIEALDIRVVTSDKEYGFSCALKDGLNILRGNNSTGKSTFFNSMIYALGMEELLGGKGESVLPYALNSYIPEGEEKYPIIHSSVKIQIANSFGNSVTLRRAIKSSDKSTKLIEVIDGKYITEKKTEGSIRPTYVHDPGSAQNDQIGYYKFLEGFCGLELPNVPSTSGDEVKLYIQTLFAAIFVEQKRGWTDYIANVPYYRIRNPKSKVVEFFLDLDVFENDRLRNSLNQESAKISQKWDTERYKLKLIEDKEQVSVTGIPIKPSIDYEADLVAVKKIDGDREVALEKYIGELSLKIEAIRKKQAGMYEGATEEQLRKIKFELGEISRLDSLYESISTEINVNQSLAREYSETIKSIESDLKKNKAAKKIRDLGGNLNLEMSSDKCPACHQLVDDSLLLADTLIQPMSIDDNISYLEKQLKMLNKYILGVEQIVNRQRRQAVQIENDIKSHKENIISTRRDIASVSELSEADIRIQIRYEDKIKSLGIIEEEISEIKNNFSDLSNMLKENRKARASLPSDSLSEKDQIKITKWEDKFKGLASQYGYKSADANEIVLNRDNYLPFLSGLALREIFGGKDTDIKSDSSASDFVRLIWAYLLSLYYSSHETGGNHLGIVAFDEPGQHSMADTSVNSLLHSINSTSGLQCIVAASFDENDDVFKAETKGIKYHLIEVDGKLLLPIN